MLMGVILSCLKVSNTIYKTKSSKFVTPHQASSLSSKLKEPTVPRHLCLEIQWASHAEQVQT